MTELKTLLQPFSKADTLDPVIRLDWSRRIVFPEWLSEIEYPELQDSGPLGFDVTDLRKDDDEINSGLVSLNDVYERHISEKIIAHDFGLRELLAIKERGPRFYSKYFPGKIVFGLKSASMRGKDIDAPYLILQCHTVLLSWQWLKNSLLKSHQFLGYKQA